MASLPLHFFIPVYFDTRSFRILREKILPVLPEGTPAHFHVLDDSAGADPLVPELSALPGVTVIPLPYNLGHQRALVYGLRRFLAKESREGLIITMDADGEDRPEDLPALLAAYDRARNPGVIVLAQRTQRQESLTFKLFYFVYKNIFRCLTGTVIQTGNFALYHTGLARRILFHPYFDLAYASALFALGANLAFVPCPRGARYEGESKMNFPRLAVHGVRMLMPFMDRIAVRGVIAFTFFTVVSFALSLGLLYGYFTGSFPVSPWVLTGALLTFMMSFLSVCGFSVLITVFANVQGLAFSRLDVHLDEEK